MRLLLGDRWRWGKDLEWRYLRWEPELFGDVRRSEDGGCFVAAANHRRTLEIHADLTANSATSIRKKYLQRRNHKQWGHIQRDE